MTTKTETVTTEEETTVVSKEAAKMPKLYAAKYFLFIAPVISMTAGYFTGQYATAIQSVLS